MAFKFKEGDVVYVNSLEYTYDYGYAFNVDWLLGTKVTLLNVSKNRYGDISASVQLELRQKIIRLHPDDLGWELTYKDPYRNCPKHFLSVLQLYKNAVRLAGRSQVDWVLYTKGQREELDKMSLKDTFKYIKDNIVNCDSCSAGCHGDPCGVYNSDDVGKKCEFGRLITEEVLKNQKELTAANNTTTACWAAVLRIWKSLYIRHNKHPNRLLAYFKRNNMSYKYLEEKDDYDFNTILKYLKYMKQGRCLPYYLKLPTEKDCDKDLYFDINISNISKPKLFWYLSVLRNPTEFPSTVFLIVQLIEKCKLEPLAAYVVGHALCTRQIGGHSNIDSRLLRLGYGNSRMIKVESIVNHIFKCRKFLSKGYKDTSIVKDKGDYKFSGWQCQDTIESIKPGKLPNITTINELLEYFKWEDK